MEQSQADSEPLLLSEPTTTTVIATASVSNSGTCTNDCEMDLDERNEKAGEVVDIDNDDKEDEDEDDENFLRPSPRKRLKVSQKLMVKKKSKPIRIPIRIHSLSSSPAVSSTTIVHPQAQAPSSSTAALETTTPITTSSTCTNWRYWLEDGNTSMDELDAELALSFYQETHEDQDPLFIKFQRQSQIRSLQKKLEEIDVEDRTSRKEIDDFIRTQLEEKQRSTLVSLEKYRLRADTEQSRDLQRLKQLYEQKVQSNNQRIQKGMQLLRERHAKELQALQQRYPQPSTFAQAQAQLAAKKQHHTDEFTARGEEAKKKTEVDYKAQIEKIRLNHQQRLADIQTNRKKILEKLMASFQQVRQRYLRRHLQRVMKRKEEILDAIQQLMKDPFQHSDAAADQSSSFSNRKSPGGDALASSESSLSPKRSSSSKSGAAATTLETTSGEDKAEFRQPSPVKSIQPWALEMLESPGGEDRKAGASARHKHRKAIMGQVTRQLSVEIHNEGLWVSLQNHNGSSSNVNNSSAVQDAASATPMNDDSASAASSKNRSSSSAADGNNNDPTGSNPVAQDEEFLLWGTRAHEVLESIVCGEIPHGYFDRFDLHQDALSAQGGQIRCVITDLRASDGTASAQRAEAAREFEETQIAELELKSKELQAAMTEAEQSLVKLQEKLKEAETALENATLDVEKAKRMQEEFTTKFRNYIGADGNVVQMPNPNDQKELHKALMNYKTNLDHSTRRENSARQAVTEINARIQKFQSVAKSSQKNFAVVSSLLKKRRSIMALSKGDQEAQGKSTETTSQEKASIRVKDVISCLRKTAEKRREHMNEKKSGSVSSTWVQSFPDLPTALKKSLWHKMHRRKQQIVLRPSPESLMNQLRSRITDTYKLRQPKLASTLEDELIKAEKLFLLALHPFSNETISTVPTTKSGETWAEPGWHLLLDVPEWDTADPPILPCKPSFPVLEKNLSEIASSPGRQAASLLKLSHFRCLASPLSTVGIASSPAETGGTIPIKAVQAEGDPLFIPEKAISAGYSFNTKPQAVKPVAPRRKSGTKEQATRPESSSLDVSGSSKKQPAVPPQQPQPTQQQSQQPQPTQQQSQQTPSEPTPKKEAKTKPPQSIEPHREQRKSEVKRRRSSKGGGESSTSRSRKNHPDGQSSKAMENPAASPRQGPRDHPRQGGENQSAAAAAAAAAAATQAAVAAHYGQFMKQMPMQPPNAQHQSPPSNLQQYVQQNQSRQQPQNPQQSQFANAQQRQLAQLRMMQQQATSPRRPQMPPNFPQPMPMPMQQFYNPLNHPNTPGRSPFPQQPPNLQGMHMQGRPPVPPQNMQNPPPGQQQQPGTQGGLNDNQNDPLFMLK